MFIKIDVYTKRLWVRQILPASISDNDRPCFQLWIKENYSLFCDCLDQFAQYTQYGLTVWTSWNVTVPRPGKNESWSMGNKKHSNSDWILHCIFNTSILNAPFSVFREHATFKLVNAILKPPFLLVVGQKDHWNSSHMYFKNYLIFSGSQP